MKHLFISALMLSWAIAGSAQLLTVTSIEKVNTPISVDQAVLSPDGSMAIVSSNTDMTLTQVNLNDGKSVKLADNALLDQLRFSDDQQSIFFVRPSFNSKHLRFKEVVSLDLNTKAEKRVAKPERNLNAVAVNGSKAAIVKAAAIKGATTAPVAFINYGQLMITDGKSTRALNPQGKEGRSYLWPSVSPDGSKVVYYLGGVGCFVCDINGNYIKHLGKLRAATWLDNNTVVGMRDHDNGQFVTDSQIIAADLNGVEQVLTDGATIAMYPSAAANKIAFSTPAGELYIININR